MSENPHTLPGADLAQVHSAAFWTGMSVMMALLAVSPQFGQLGPGTLWWISANALLALLANGLALYLRRQQPTWLRLRPAQLLVLLSALCWGLGAALIGTGLDFEQKLPFIVSVSGLACAAVWLYRRDLFLFAGIVSCLLLPALALLMSGYKAGWATAAILGVLVIVNLLIDRRPSNDVDDTDVVELAQPTERAVDAEERGQTLRMTQELQSELERARSIEGELKKAKADAEAANMSKGEFLATMSHEIRTPLNGIIPLLEILKETSLQPDQREYVNTAYSSARSLLSIIDDILDFSKIEANKLELETVGLNVREVVDSVMRLMKSPAERKGLTISVQIDPQVRLVGRGDPVRLRQVLTNLVSNAVKFTEKGSVQIQVSKRGDSRTHQELMFSVRDSGIGLTNEQQTRLFKPFSQADTSTTRTFGGTGLGLVICKRIVDLMAGKIGVKSESGRGSMFWFQISLLKAIGDIAGGTSRRDLSGARAMVVANDGRFVQRIGAYLSGWGVQHANTTTTAEAAGKIKSASAMGETWRYDLVVIDLATMRTTAPGFLRSQLRENGLDNLRFVFIEGDEPAPIELRDEARCVVLSRGYAEAELMGACNRLLDVETATRLSLLEEAKQFGVDEFAPVAAAVDSGQLGGHVLLVEDNPVNRQVAQRIVSMLGLSIDVAEHGKEALEKIRDNKFDLVLMDCQMPVMDGYTATRSRRMMEADRNLPRLPIVAMTANAMVGDREKCLAAGMDDYLSKPLNRDLIRETLRKWLPKDAVSRPSVEVSAPPPARPAPPTGPSGDQFDLNALGIPDFGALTDAPIALDEDVLSSKLYPTAVPVPAAATPPIAQPAAAPPAPRAPSPPVPSAPPRPAPTPAPVPKAEPVAVSLRTTPAIDRAVFDELLDIMGSDFMALVRVYLDDTPKHLRAIADAAKRGEVPAMVAPAHSLKSTSANLGALALSDLAKQIEHGARTKSLTEPIPLVKALIAEFQRAEKELRSMLANS